MFPNRLKIVAAALAGVGAVTVLMFGVAAPPLLAEDKAPPKTALLRVPDHGIQPQAAVDVNGVVQLVLYKLVVERRSR